MHHVRRSPTVRSLLVTVVAVVATTHLAWPAVASAEDSAPPVASGALPPVASGALPPVASGDVVVGELVQAWPEHERPVAVGEHADEGPLTWVETPDGVSVRVSTEDIEDLPSADVGATVRVRVGDEVPDEGLQEGLAPAREVLSAAVVADGSTDRPLLAAGGPVTAQVTVVLAVPRGAVPDAQSLQQLVDTVNGPVAAYWAGQSGGAIRTGVTQAVDLRAVPTTAGCADPAAMWNEVAARVGWYRAPGRHLLVHVPAGAGDCGIGLAEVGPYRDAGGRLYVRSASPAVIAHELGHNFGLGHSSELQCDGQVEAGACQITGYNDWYDVMGVSWSETGSLSTPQAARIGLLPAAAQVVVTASSGSGTHAVAPVGTPVGTRAIRLDAAGGAVYWLEYRAAVGQDDWLASPGRNWPGLEAQVTVRRSAEGSDTSLLLDPSPAARARWGADRQVGLAPGQSLSLAGGQFTVTVLGAGAVAQVRVDVGSGTGGPGPVPPAASDIGGSGSSYYLNDAFDGIANTLVRFGEASDTVYTGDWDGNGTDTLAVRRGNTYYVRNDTNGGAATLVFAYGDPGDPVYVGDWDGNGTDTLAVRRGNTFFVKNDTRSGVADAVFGYGDPGDVVLVGDWDGDGDDTLAVRRGATYFVKNDVSTGIADRVLVYGEPADTVLVGRWAPGAGSTLAVRRGNAYFLKYSLSTGFADLVFGYGDPTDTAFVGDWDGNGVDSLGVRRAG